jgi:hypothetical protein
MPSLSRRRFLQTATGAVVTVAVLRHAHALNPAVGVQAATWISGFWSGKLFIPSGSLVVHPDASKLGLPQSANDILLSVFYNAYFPQYGFTGYHPIIGNGDADGGSSLAVRILPASGLIPGSTNKPMLQLSLESDSLGTHFINYIVPDFAAYDNLWHNMAVAFSRFGTSNSAQLMAYSDGVWKTGIYADRNNVPLASQQMQPFFPIPMVNTGINSTDTYAVWLGNAVGSKQSNFNQAITAQAGQPLNAPVYPYVFNGRMAQVYMSVNQGAGANIAAIVKANTFMRMVDLVQYAQGQTALALQQSQGAQAAAQDLIQQINAQKLAQAKTALAQALAALASSQKAAAAAHAGATINNYLGIAQTYVAAAQADIQDGTYSNAVVNLATANNNINQGNILLQAQISSNTTSQAQAIILPSGASNVIGNTTPQIYLNGNYTTDQDTSGNYISSGSGSIYQNQGVVNGNDTSFITPAPAPDNSSLYFTVAPSNNDPYP